MLKDGNSDPGILYPAKLPFACGSELKTVLCTLGGPQRTPHTNICSEDIVGGSSAARRERKPEHVLRIWLARFFAM